MQSQGGASVRRPTASPGSFFSDAGAWLFSFQRGAWLFFFQRGAWLFLLRIARQGGSHVTHVSHVRSEMPSVVTVNVGVLSFVKISSSGSTPCVP